ncbi:MAG: 2-hydroxyacid dehydrogenase [Candidatus Heimdallarchaeota archaeon]
MKEYNVLVTRKIPQKALDYLESEGVTLDINKEDRVLTYEEIQERIKGKDGLLCLLTDKIDGAIMDAAGDQLQVIVNYAVGYNNINVKDATERGIPVTNTPGVLTETTADLAFALMLSIARRIVESDKYTRKGLFKGWGPLLHLGGDIFGKTLGIIGMGRIGSAVAYRAAKGFNMKIKYYSRNRNKVLEKELNMEFCSVDEILKTADYVTLHVPLTKETKYLIGKKELELMKPTAYLVNTSRGPVVKEDDLLEALKKNKIAGAALDVYEFEPEITKGLEKLDNVIITAHIGTATIDTRTEMGMMIARDLLAVFRGEEPQNCVNKEVLM